MFTLKASAVFLSALVLLLLHTQGAAAQTADKARKEIGDNTMASLIQGLNTDNDGLQSSCAYWIGEYCISEAIIPLQKLLRNDESEGVRINAALALFKIGTPLAINTIKQAVRFDKSNRVKRMTEIFYSVYINQKHQEKNFQYENGLLAKGN